MAIPEIPLLIKQPAESILYDFDFAPLLASGETLSSITSITGIPSGLTISGEAVNGNDKARCRILGGTNNVKYLVTAKVATSDSNTRETEGYLLVKDLGS